MNIINKIRIIAFLVLLVSQSYTQDLKSIRKVNEYIQQQIELKKIAGAVILVSQNDRILMHKSYGYQDIQDNIHMDTSSIFRIYSMTKPLTSLSIMMLVDRGEISLEDSIVTYLPELKDLKVLEGKKECKLNREIKIRDLLRHSSGFAYGGGLGFSKVDRLYNKKHPLLVADGNDMINRLAQLPLLFHPGEEYHYSISVDVLGVIVERVSKMKLSDFMTKNIFKPLGMVDTYFKLPESKKERFCSIYGIGLKLKESYKITEYINDRMEEGGGGLVSTSSDYLKFCSLLLNKGIYNSDTLISPFLIAEMTKNQLPIGVGLYKADNEVAIGFGFGFSINLQELGQRGHKGDFGWSGIGGTHFTISPKKKLVLIIMTQKQPFSLKIKNNLTPIILNGID